MNDLTVRRLEMSIKAAEYLTSNPIVFRKGSRGPQLVSDLHEAVKVARALVSKQLADIGQSHANSAVRAAARETVREALLEINKCAHGLAVAEAGLEEKFQMPRNTSDAKFLAGAHAFAENAAPYVKEFVAFEMAPDFLDDLNARIDAFEKAVGEHNAAKTGNVVTRQEIADAMKRVLAILEQLDPIIGNKLKDDSAEIRKWENVRHVERAWVSKKKEKAEAKPPADSSPAPPSVPVVPPAPTVAA